MTAKYRKVPQNGMYRIIALRSFGEVIAGDVGGFITRSQNLDHQGDAWVSGDARVDGNARVSGNAWVRGNAWVGGNARAGGNAWVTHALTKDISDTRASLYAQTGHLPDPSGFVTLFKRTYSDNGAGVYPSLYDPSFVFVPGETAEVPDAEESEASCAPGIHVSTAGYGKRGSTLLALRIHIDDIITIQEGKVRCRKAFVLGEVEEVVR